MAVAPANPTQITPPRVALIDDRTGAISREWYRFFLSLRSATEVTQQEASLVADSNSLLASYSQMLEEIAHEQNAAPDSNTFTASLASQFYTFQNDVLVAPPSLFGTVTSVGASGGTTGLTFTGSPITTSGTFTLGGTLGIANGGTNGTATATAGAVSYGTGTAYAFSAVGTSGQVLTSAGAGAPTWTTPTTGTVTSVTGTAPVVSSGGSTPAISMAAATTSVNGYLTSTDWTTFNNKGSGSVTSVGGTGTVNGITLTGTVTTTGNLTLGGTLSGVSLTTQVSGVLPAVNGGTGQSVYAVGDLLYASTTTALSKLADVATGNAIISGGVGVAPLYGKIGLTTHVSGTLPVANGGTGVATLSSGYLVKGNTTSPVLTSVVYDTGTNVGIGNTAPGAKLEVTGDVLTTWAAASTKFIGSKFSTSYELGMYMDSDNRTLTMSAKGADGLGTIVFKTGATPTERARIDNNGNVGIGATANASAILDVQSTTKGVRMPNMTTTQKNAITSPAAGLMVFDTTLAKLCVYSGAAWQTVTSI
jgi:hypothetical protein